MIGRRLLSMLGLQGSIKIAYQDIDRLLNEYPMILVNNPIILAIMLTLLYFKGARALKSYKVTQYFRDCSVRSSTIRKPSSIFSVAGEIIDQRENLDRNTYLFGENVVKFKDLGICAELASSLAAQGFEDATMIQAKAIPPALAGSDVVIGAETGSGKTLAFLLPVLDRLIRNDWSSKKHAITDDESDVIEDLLIDEENPIENRPKRQYPRAVILMPNKELCAQVLEVANKLLTNIQTNATIGIMFTTMLPYCHKHCHNDRSSSFD
jgi:ATP-dependent helicase YprA (DUF1998 family)